MHLALNLYGFVIAAIFVEPIFGRFKFGAIYLLSGICASLSSIMWYDKTASVGASGAIFGIYGAILALTLTPAIPKGSKGGLLLFIGPYVVINLLSGLGSYGIDNAAHIGGLISGAILGLLLYDKKMNSNDVF